MKTVTSKGFESPAGKSSMIFQALHLLENNEVVMAESTVMHRQRTIFVASIVAAGMIASAGSANAALISPCSGVSLAPSVITDIVGAAVLPITGTLDGGLAFLLGPLGLNSNLTTTLGGIASGDPINLNILDSSGNIISPADTECQTTADGYSLDTPKGISIGGNQISGLGNGVVANAGEMNSIAFGNGSVTNAAAINSLAIGPNAFIDALGTNSTALGSGARVDVANSVALGANSRAIVGAETDYNAYGLDDPQTSVGEVSIGSTSNTRKITNLAAGSADTDAVNVSQLSGAVTSLLINTPLQYSDVNGLATPNTPSNHVTLVGSAVGPVTVHNVAAGSAANDAVNVSQLQALEDIAVKYDSSLKMTVTLGDPLSGATKITNLADGDVDATSTDAVNGSQLFGVTANMDALGLSMETNLGGGANYDPITGAVSAPTYNVYGEDQTNVGDAINALQLTAPLQYSNAAGVAMPYIPSNHVTLVGSTVGQPVTIHNVADGAANNDAVNVGQLNAVQTNVTNLQTNVTNLQTNVTNLDALAVKYDDTNRDIISLAGTTGTKITNLANGEVSATSKEAINGSQLFAISNSITTNAANMDALGLSMATNLGGGASYNSATGAVSAPTYNVYGTNQSDVGTAISVLQINAPLQYSNAAGDATPDTRSNHVTLVGSALGPVSLHNVANGEVSLTSTDAINGSQLYATNQMISSMSSGGGIKYFHAKSSYADSAATGDESVAIGSRSLASGVGSIAMGDNSQATNTGAIAIGQNSISSSNGSVAMGNNSQATNTGAIAIGQNSESSGENSIAIGTGALATGSVAVGVGAQAGNDGAAFGDNAIALTPQQGTALGNAATVTANRGVALGAGAQATRAGMNGATEKYSNVAVTSTEGAVSVGSAGNERQITNVAGGTADTDAVNVRQLDAAVAQASIETNNRINSLHNDISSVKHDSNAGTASALSMASMPQSVIPGKVMVAAGVANYQGQSAMSVGVSNFSENGRWVVNFNGTANTRGNAGAAVGVGFHW